jgi:hypothetical protein
VSLPLAAQDYTAAFARSIESDVAVLSAQTITLARWGQTHRAGKVELAHIQTGRDDHEFDFTQESRWCAASSDALPPVARTALFYVPTVKSGALPPLPVAVDPSLTNVCQLHAMWYQTRTYSSAEVLTRELTLLWGAPNGHSARPMLWDSGRWMRAVSWQRPGVSVWVAEDPDGPRPRLIAFATKDDAGRAGDDEQYELLDEALTKPIAEAAAKIAGQDATLTKWMLGACAAESNPKEPENVMVDKLSTWLKQAAALSPERRAASLLVADVVVKCADSSGAVSKGLVALGATFPEACIIDGPTYSHNWRDQAARLAPNTRVDELAAVAGFTEPCSLKGHGSWMDIVIARGEKLSAGSPLGEWTPWLHYAMAKAHAATLMYTYPGADPEGGNPVVMTPAAKGRERAEAIRYFRLFAAEKPAAPEAVSAWYQGWRLLAGLPPPPIRSGCGCE